MEFVQLEILQHMAENGSIQKTAEKMRMSAGSVRSHLQSLEEEVGCRFFESDSNYRKLSTSGEIMLKYAHRILGMKQDLSSRLHDSDYLDNSVTLIMESASSVLRPLISDFQEQNPHVRIKVLQMPIPEKNQEFLADLMAYVSPFPAQDENTVTLMKTQCCLAISARNPLSRRIFLDLEEVRGEEFVLPSHNHDIRRVIDDCFVQVGYKPEVPMEVDNPHLLQRLVAEDTGLSFLLPSITREETGEGICLVPLRHPDGSLFVNLRWNQWEWLSPAARKFRDFILEYFRISPAEEG